MHDAKPTTEPQPPTQKKALKPYRRYLPRDKMLVSPVWGIEADPEDAYRWVQVGSWDMRVWAAARDGEPRLCDAEAGRHLRRSRTIREIILKAFPGEALNTVYQRPTPPPYDPDAPWMPYELEAAPPPKLAVTTVDYWLTERQLVQVIRMNPTPAAMGLIPEVNRVWEAARRRLETVLPRLQADAYATWGTETERRAHEEREKNAKRDLAEHFKVTPDVIFLEWAIEVDRRVVITAVYVNGGFCNAGLTQQRHASLVAKGVPIARWPRPGERL